MTPGIVAEVLHFMARKRIIGCHRIPFFEVKVLPILRCIGFRHVCQGLLRGTAHAYTFMITFK